MQPVTCSVCTTLPSTISGCLFVVDSRLPACLQSVCCVMLSGARVRAVCLGHYLLCLLRPVWALGQWCLALLLFVYVQ
jgi:hypothetical protein